MFQENPRCKKYKNVIFGPFQIIYIGSNSWYCKLQLPVSSTIHPVFSIGLLERYKEEDSNNPAIMTETYSDNLVPESILASRPLDDNVTQHVLIVKCKDFASEENTL
jgi:hypothetical protein